MTSESEGSANAPGDAFGNLLAEQEADRQWRAFHEAGHIAAAFALRARLLKADIVPQGPSGGRAVYVLGNDGGPSSLDDVTICLAGPIAAKRHAPWCHDGGSKDREDVARHLNALARTAEARDALHAHCRRKAEEIIGTHWDVVEGVAAALLEHDALNDLDLADVIEGIADARRRREWRALEARTANPHPPAERLNHAEAT